MDKQKSWIIQVFESGDRKVIIKRDGKVGRYDGVSLASIGRLVATNSIILVNNPTIGLMTGLFRGRL